MTPLRTSLIRLAHENPGLRPHLLPILKGATGTKVPKEIVDPKSGKNYEDLKAEYEATINSMYGNLEELWGAESYKEHDTLSKKIDVYRAEMKDRLYRLRVRTEKAKRGLRLSSKPEHMAGMPSRGDWGFSDLDVSSAILRGDEVVGWVVGKREMGQTVPKGSTISIRNREWVIYTAYTLGGEGVGTGQSSATEALKEFHRVTQI